jgi:hypothetical protein
VTAAVVTIRNSNRPKASSATSAFWPIASSLCTAGQRRRTSLSSTPIKTGLYPNRRKRDLRAGGYERGRDTGYPEAGETAMSDDEA